MLHYIRNIKNKNKTSILIMADFVFRWVIDPFDSDSGIAGFDDQTRIKVVDYEHYIHHSKKVEDQIKSHQQKDCQEYHQKLLEAQKEYVTIESERLKLVSQMDALKNKRDALLQKSIQYTHTMMPFVWVLGILKIISSGKKCVVGKKFFHLLMDLYPSEFKDVKKESHLVKLEAIPYKDKDMDTVCLKEEWKTSAYSSEYDPEGIKCSIYRKILTEKDTVYYPSSKQIICSMDRVVKNAKVMEKWGPCEFSYYTYGLTISTYVLTK